MGIALVKMALWDAYPRWTGNERPSLTTDYARTLRLGNPQSGGSQPRIRLFFGVSHHGLSPS